MKYGVCNWIFGAEDLSATADYLAQTGFDGVELKGDLEQYQAAEVDATLGDRGLAVLSLTPEDVDLAHPDAQVRQSALDYYLRLLDFTAEIGAPLVSCHGAVGRIRALSDHAEEYHHLLNSVHHISRQAAKLNLLVAMEVLNRYESHLLNTASQAVEFVVRLGAPNVGILLDAYHMNIEEDDPADAILEAADHLFLFHVADSNRRAIGRGHTDFPALMTSLQRIDYTGDVIVECTAAGPDPFTPVKEGNWRAQVKQYAAESLQFLKACESDS